MKKRFIAYPIIFITAFLFYLHGRSIWHPFAIKIIGKKTVPEVIEKYSSKVQKDLSPKFAKAGISYPPKKLALIAFKDTKQLEVWAANNDEHYSLITTYQIQAASGKLGPKLKEGDRQVPEGIYKITGFNPNSSYHLSMKLNYPNSFDLHYARLEGRDKPGTNIFIHGRAASIGCLAMGDSTIEELFSLVYATGKSNTTVLISPTDPSKNNFILPTESPSWTSELYKEIKDKYINITKKPNTAISDHAFGTRLQTARAFVQVIADVSSK